MQRKTNAKYIFFSAACHLGLLIILMLGFDFAAPIAVIENTQNKDVISAVILGDTKKSNILPQKLAAKIKPKKTDIKKEINQPSVAKNEPSPPQKITQPDIKKDVIALKPKENKKLPDKKKQELVTSALLDDIKKQSDQQKKKKQKQELKSQFEKILREQAEQSLRQQLLNEEIKLKGTQSRQAQGEVNKYKALIIQAISENWIVPTQANKKLSCELIIRLAPGGIVLDVQVSRSSGDPSLDSSARAAVLKSSPLPVPPDADAFSPFRQFVLKVKPENILSDNPFAT